MITKLNENNYSLNGILKTIGPGILYAGAAIGASHLVQATRAGASYGFSLVWAVILINLFKYPFFEYGHRFTAATGKTLIEGYKMLGTWAVAIFFVLSFATGIVNFAAIALVTTSLGSLVFQIKVNSSLLSISVLVSLLVILKLGRYRFLDIIIKILLVLLAIATIIAFIIAAIHGRDYSTEFVHPEIWNATGITFLIALMGWMPTPIEASTWPSLWAKERNKQTKYKPKFTEYMIDFHIGYLGSSILALFFLGLGALVMYGSGEVFSNSSLKFSEQLIDLYAKTFGNWSIPMISGIAFITIFSTALTVIDGYPRSLEASFIGIFKKYDKNYGRIFWLFAVFLSLFAALIIGVFNNKMKAFLDFATIISFLAAPFFAIINYKVVTSKFIPDESKPKKWLRILSYLGIIFLIGFSLLFIYSRIFL